MGRQRWLWEGRHLLRNLIIFVYPPAPAGQMNDVDMQIGNILITGEQTPLLLPYTGQTPTFTTSSESYAGMEINNVAGVIGRGEYLKSRMQFRDLNNGIIAINSSLLVQNATFTQIRNTDNYTLPMNAINGTGIFAGAGWDKYGSLTQVGLGINDGVNTPPLTFEDCDLGIHTNHVSTDISLNKMDEIINTGIRCENTARYPVRIVNNQIGSYSMGIHMAHNRNSVDLEVGGNSVFWCTQQQVSPPGLYGILYDAAAHYLPNSNKHDIICNTVSGDFSIGMQLSDLISNAKVQTNSVDMSSDYMTTGMRIISSAQFSINSNTVTGDDVGIGSAYRFMLNNDIEVSDNFSYKTAIGFDFSGPNSNTKLFTNNIGLPCVGCTTNVTDAHNIGLHLDLFGVIGEQFITGPSSVTVFENLWAEDPGQTSNVYTSTNGAVNENPSVKSCDYSQFKFPSNSTQGSADYPYNTCSGTGNWFLGELNPTLQSLNYSDDCSPYQRIADEYISMLDQFIALDSSFTESLPSEIKYIMKSVLMDKLLANDSLAGDSLMGAFLSSQINTTLGKLAIERSFIDHLFDDDPDLVILLYQNDSIIRSLLQEKSTLDSLISGNAGTIDSIAAVEESAIVLSQLSELTVKQNEILTELNGLSQARIDSALSYNNSISVSSVMEENEKKVNDIYLEKIVVGDLNLDSTQLADLDFIAPQCPFYGGRAVIRARETKRMLGDTTQYNDQYLCDTTNGSRIGHFNKGRLNQPWIRVIPNPAQESLVFEYELPRDTPAKIIIFDTLGKIIDKLVVSANSNKMQFNASLLQNDIYLYRLQVDDGSVSNGKIVIVK